MAKQYDNTSGMPCRMVPMGYRDKFTIPHNFQGTGRWESQNILKLLIQKNLKKQNKKLKTNKIHEIIHQI
jgi:hypothetical protein